MPNCDVRIGNLFTQAMDKVSKEGVITVKEGRTIEVEIIESMPFDRGFTSPYSVTDVLQDISPFLEAAVQGEETAGYYCEGEALAACILNKLGICKLQLSKLLGSVTTASPTSRTGNLVLAGGAVFTDELDIQLEHASTDLLGFTGSIIVTKEDRPHRLQRNANVV